MLKLNKPIRQAKSLEVKALSIKAAFLYLTTNSVCLESVEAINLIIPLPFFLFFSQSLLFGFFFFFLFYTPLVAAFGKSKASFNMFWGAILAVRSHYVQPNSTTPFLYLVYCIRALPQGHYH